MRLNAILFFILTPLTSGAAIINGPMVASTGGGGTPVLTYQGFATSDSDLTSYSFTSQPIGNVIDRHYVKVGVIGRSSGANGVNVSSVTIGGISATLDPGALSQANDTTNSIVTAIYTAAVPSGTTASVDVVFNQGCAGAAIFVYTIKDNSSNTPYDTTLIGTTSISASLNSDTPPGNSVVIGFAYVAQTANLTISWTGLSEDSEPFWDTSRNASSAHGSFSSAGTQTITMAWGGTSNINCGLSASYQ